MPNITVTVTPEQGRLFQAMADTAQAKPGEVLLGLACDRVEANPYDGELDIELMALCWKFTKAGKLPDAGRWLTEEQWKKLGYDGPAVELAPSKNGTK